MADQHDPLTALWSASEAPARDPAFELAVDERIVRRQLALDVTLLVGASLVGVLALWALWPSLTGILQALASPFSGVLPVLAVVAALGALAFWLSRPPIDVDG